MSTWGAALPPPSQRPIAPGSPPLPAVLHGVPQLKPGGTEPQIGPHSPPFCSHPPPLPPGAQPRLQTRCDPTAKPSVLQLWGSDPLPSPPPPAGVPRCPCVCPTNGDPGAALEPQTCAASSAAPHPRSAPLCFHHSSPPRPTPAAPTPQSHPRFGRGGWDPQRSYGDLEVGVHQCPRDPIGCCRGCSVPQRSYRVL